MNVTIDTRAINRNIRRAEGLVKSSIGLMFKEFYEDIYYQLGDVKNNIFSKNIPGSVCYGIGSYKIVHGAAVVNSLSQYKEAKFKCGIRKFYIPVNAHDDREGLCLGDAYRLCALIREQDTSSEIYCLITSGCLNEKHPSTRDLQDIWNALKVFVKHISLGGSFWLAEKHIPQFVGEIRIGEYMLFGTIPYSKERSIEGECAISMRAKVLNVFRERRQLIIDCGYSLADVDKCRISNNGLKYLDSSSEYTIFRYEGSFKEGDDIIMTPNYKSLVKLKDAERNYL